MRVAIVNDSLLAIEALRRVLIKGGHTVAWVAKDGIEAIAECKSGTPDVLLMDLRMPVMDGVECTRRIMAESPCAILVVTAVVADAYEQVYDAMGAGALDAVNTPVLGAGGDVDGGLALLHKLETIGKLVGRGHGRPSPPSLARSARDTAGSPLPPLVAIGASTGGPQALADLLTGLPADLPAAIVIVQHVDPDFAAGLATWLRERSRFPTELAIAGRRPQAGLALVAASNDHLILNERQRLAYTPVPRRYPYRPSVDVFFHSAAQHWPRRSVAAILTGMGKDGAAGMLALREAGWTTIAQDEATCVVYGMPRAAAELGAATRVLPIGSIARAIIEAVAGARTRT